MIAVLRNGGMSIKPSVPVASNTMEQLTPKQEHEKTLQDNYREYRLQGNGSKVVFEGLTNQGNGALYSRLVPNTKVGVQDSYTTEIELSLDMGTLEFELKARLMDGNVIVDEYVQVSQGYVTETGGLEAKLNIEGREYLLSELYREYYNQGNGQARFIWLIVIVIVTVVIVKETAEEIRSRENYDHNRWLEDNGKGLSTSNYITAQWNYPLYNYRFGFTNFADVGCGPSAVYNLTKSVGKTDRLSDVIRKMEDYQLAFGFFGSNPYEIYDYLKYKGISHTKHNVKYNDYKKEVEKKQNAKLLMCEWNSGSVWNWSEGAHIYFVDKVGDVYTEYNYDTSPVNNTSNNLDDFVKNNGGGFLVGYIV
jgi:hypothetical protein